MTTQDSIPFALPRTTPKARARAALLLAQLKAHYPNAHCELNFTSPHELLVATILSAQATDVSVNKATPALFKHFPTPAHFARAKPTDIEPFIRTIGLFRNKANSIHAAMSALVDRFGGEVPRTMDELLSLRGVARKTANVVLGNAFNINVGLVVDTHVERLALRLGLVKPATTVAMIERTLMALFPRPDWCLASHLLIWHGRRACKARIPGAAGCAGCTDSPTGPATICRDFGARCELRISAPKKPPRPR